MTLRYDLVVFDFDGTLADSLTWFRTALSDVVEKHGLNPICEDRAETLRGMTPKAIMDELAIPAWKLPFIAADVRARAADNIDQITLFEGIAELLQQLHAAGITIAVVSSNGEDAIRQVMGSDLVALVSHFACGAALFGKAAVFRKVIRKAGSTPSRTLCIGDEVRDIDAAREAGCGCGAVIWGFATPEILAASGPDHLYETPGEIARCIAPAEPATQRA
ncbi:HAD hydrolase-like protein [Maricaulis sp.]|uniref:HAD hydrolase-like protein n=1 Tax=Maricaulis sp. TaxID=1486257 RepID=UPI003A8D2E57